MITRSRKLGLPFDIDILTVDFIDELLIAQPRCTCCGEVFDVSFKHDGKLNARSPSIDRLRPADGYTLTNIALLCWRCNNLKRDASIAELRRIADWMAERGLR